TVQKSSINPAYSLTIDQASSTPSTLTVMTIVTVCLLPIVLVYVFWSYWMFRARVGAEDVETQTGLLLKKVRIGENFLAG
ncbi:MAG: cytochrome d ubiquinol oxidase subunit II, partial [Actinomyces sp.]|nr:cytochrome d ubiquinol oxidase subunit II [Actinomyces sp.]